MSPEYRARIEEGRPRLLAIAKETYGLELNQGPFGINSRPALIGAKYADAQGAGAAYNRVVLRAYWQEAQNIEDRTVLADVAESVGIARDAFLAALDDPAYDQQVQADVNLAQHYGLGGVPAIVFDMRYLISGAQPYATLVEATEQILHESQADGQAND